MLMQPSIDPTLLFESVKSTEGVTPMKYSIDPTLLLESVESTKVVMLMQYFVDPTLLMGSDVSTGYVLSFLVQYFQNKGACLSLRAHPLQVLG
jgi:hypothetical protein